VTTIVAAFALTAGMVAQATGGRLASGAPDREFASISINSRALPAGALFIALVGERFDGHAFVPDVIAAGAAGVLVARAPAVAGGAAVIVVEDTLVALQRLAHDVRVRSGAKLVAVTGSAGKTTTKEVAADFLGARHRVFRNQGNLNNHIGLPLSLLELRHGADVAVVELGMNHAGEIRTLVAIAEPDVRVWTNVGDAHIGFFSTTAAIADAKAEILEQARPSDVLVANADDALVMERARGFSGRVVTFGAQAAADVKAANIVDRGFDGTECDVVTPFGRGRLLVPLAGRAQLSNVLAATAVALECGVPLSEIEARAAQLRAVDHRGAMSDIAQGARLVDDSYNASPAAVQAMLRALQATPASGRRIAVLGEMLELGDAAYTLHEACGRAAAAAGVDALVVIGGSAASGLAHGAAAAGLDAARIHRFDTSAEAADAMPALIGPGDLVLVKGSRGTRTDLVVDRLKAVA
jgi:UDP-N-acetylmuramoyl-tripeptide--D-alanyl-D-alanine ligase